MERFELGRFSKFFGRVDRKYLVNTFLIAIIYVITAKLGLLLAFTTDQVTTVWPPTGIALVALLILGYRHWPAVAIGAFLANISLNEPWMVAGGIAAGNTLEALAGTFLLKRVAGINPKDLLSTTRNILLFVALAALSSTVIAATIGTLSLALGGLIQWSNYASVWFVWWVGDMMGNLIFVPFLLSLLNREYLKSLRQRVLEMGILLGVSLTVSALVFTYSPEAHLPIVPLSYMVFPVLIWAALRLTQPGVGLVMFAVAVTAIWGTVAGLGPFTGQPSVEGNLILLQLFLFVASVTSLLVAAVVDERFSATASLRLQTKQLTSAQAKLSRELEKRKKLEQELKEAHRRATDILAGVLDGESPRRR